ncbi:uncharacterized protein LOC123269779 [Cotesia glomerata]|uniref:uncharacterized protein LOC123269779 n=1 Tax=Cotesia glomerata TaxID=32391 RepID=UPI001D030663|nr:uncharacterized protein LOC123269779 [Cotesia glomerata]
MQWARDSGFGRSFPISRRKDEDAPKYRHNHVGEADLLEDAIFLKEMHSLLCHSFLQNKAIYNKLKILYPSAALKYPFERVSARMRQWRLKRKFPELTHGFNTLINLLNHDDKWKDLKSHNKGSLVVKPIMTRTDEVCGVAVADLEFLAIVKAALHQFIYFEEIPIKLGDIDGSRIIVMTVPFKTHSFPAAWTALNKDSFEDYNKLVRNGLSKVLGDVQPEKIYYDFHNKLFTALRGRYPATRLKGTLDAYSHLLYVNAMETIDLRARNAVHEIRIFSKIFLVALLPPQQIVKAFVQVVQNLNEQMFQKFELFLIYYLSEWLNKVGPSNLSFYNDVDGLSNCTRIHFNRLQNMSGVAPDTWSFLESATSIECESYRDVDKLAKRKLSVEEHHL